ncbi:MAG: NifB/NifX family molybdenum-iron cluster-binding protein [Phycisphaerae bacterium]
MKLCIPAESPQLEARVDARLARAACFVLVDSETGEMLESIPNEQNQQAASGAGIQAGQTIAQTGVEAVLCGHCGPKAFRVLQAAGITVYTGATGTVGDAIRAFREGNLKKADEANVEGHW